VKDTRSRFVTIQSRLSQTLALYYCSLSPPLSFCACTIGRNKRL